MVVLYVCLTIEPMSSKFCPDIRILKHLLLSLLQISYPHFLQVLRYVLPLSRDRNIVVLPLLLGQQLEPPRHRALDNLTHSKAEGPHKVIPGRPVPVPDLN